MSAYKPKNKHELVFTMLRARPIVFQHSANKGRCSVEVLYIHQELAEVSEVSFFCPYPFCGAVTVEIFLDHLNEA